MFSDLGKAPWLPQIDINAVKAQATGISVVFCSAPFYRWLWILQGEDWVKFISAPLSMGNQIKWQIQAETSQRIRKSFRASSSSCVELIGL